MEKLVLALVFAAKRLRRYFQAYPIAVITDQPIKQIISRPDVAGRLQKWSVMLGEHNITYRPRTSVKGQILADFLVEKPDDAPADISVKETPKKPSQFDSFSISHVSRSKNKKTDALSKIASTSFAHLSKQVLVEILNEKSINGKEVAALFGEEEPTWMTPIVEYPRDGILPEDSKDASKLRIKARQYELLQGVLYRRSFLKPWLRCVGPLQADYVIR
ncbi:reverse transcriptase domain-containing protein [Tanacetum coccineum]